MSAKDEKPFNPIRIDREGRILLDRTDQNNDMVCKRKYHDAFGEPNCSQCAVREMAGQLPENPFLKPIK